MKEGYKNMKEVTKEEFYNTLGQLDVVIKAIGYFPHSLEFRQRDGLLMGKIVKTFTDGIKYPVISRYYIRNE